MSALYGGPFVWRGNKKALAYTLDKKKYLLSVGLSQLIILLILLIIF
jgi:hypothetical protein